jgi:hypothetical protein
MGTLVIAPADDVIDAATGETPTVTFQVTRDGADVTAQTRLTLDNAALGSITGAVFTADANGAGTANVFATLGKDSGSTTITVRRTTTVLAPGAPSDAAGQFGGATDPAATPVLVYPPDGVLIPPNTNELEVQFTAAPSTTLFEIGFTSPSLALRIYTPCNAVGGGCGLTPDANTWMLLAAAARGGTVEISLRATGPSGTVGVAATRKLSFTDEDLMGGLYYWAAASGAVNRYDFGLRGQKAESFYTPAQAGAICVGCHALSRDGSRIAVGLNAPAPATLRLLDVATRATLFESAASGLPGAGGGGSNFEALSPDGKLVLMNDGANLTLHDATAGTSMNASLSNANMPDWSADGANIVFARGAASACPLGLCGANPGVDGASLYTAPVMSGAFGPEVLLAQPGGNDNYYYPSFSPDGTWVAFNKSGSNSFDAMDARVMIVQNPGGNPVELAAVNTTVGNSWPKFAPFSHHFQGKTIYWLTFSSRRDYGLRLQNSQKSSMNQVAQVWMVAVSPDRVMTAGDGGYPPFWLPFQDMTTGNHIAQWTQKVARQTCSNGSPCPQGEFCDGGSGLCLPNPS